MVAPLNIDGGVLHEEIQNAVRAVTAVKEVTDDVDALDGKPLDEDTERLDIIRTSADLNDGFDELLIVKELRLILLGTRVHQLDDNGLIAFRNVAVYL